MKQISDVESHIQYLTNKQNKAFNYTNLSISSLSMNIKKSLIEI